MQLDTSLRLVPGIGPAMGQRLENLNLFTVEDLINHFPFRYQDFSNITSVPEIHPGETITLQGQVWSIANTYTKSRKVLTRAILNDGSGSIELVWFNSAWLAKSIATGDMLQVSGKVDRKGSKYSMVMPQWEKIARVAEIGDSNTTISTEASEQLHTGRLVPVYPETFGITSKWLRTKIAQILPQVKDLIQDPLPPVIRDGMYDLKIAYEQIHYPDNIQTAQKAKDRLSFDELFFIQLATQYIRQKWKEKASTKSWNVAQSDIDTFLNSLPYTLTGAQKRVIQEIAGDVSLSRPMNRLVQGDVGSGKTIVAAAIMYLGHKNGLRSLYMAPTEILAFQHYNNLTKFLSPFGITLGLYTGSRKELGGRGTGEGGKLKKKPQPPTTNLHPDIIVGTHALLSDKLETENVGLVVVDEQQRFGVGQRTKLREKAKSPHFLTMTATPIPRTVALTLYGDLELSIIDEMPAGRKEIRTHFVPESKRQDSYTFIENEIKAGHQAYLITPLIEESETIATVKAATVEYETLSKKVFPKLRLGLLHGRMKSKEKDEVLTAFKDHKLDILVSTSVVEVGVDVPNATIMVIEGAERFGLAQLHQLRGRVGRGEAQSYTFLFATDQNPMAINRLKNLEHIHDGLKLAELDLQIRGSGELFGVRQSGRWNLKIASLSDLGLIEKTRHAALKILSESPSLDKYPLIEAKLGSTSSEVLPD
jgi:ATP-dependent DNA helicase RecG